MLVKVMEAPTQLFASAKVDAEPLCDLPVGSDLELGEVIKSGGTSAVKAKLPNGMSGFIPANARVLQYRLFSIEQKSAVVFTEPSMTSLPVGEFPHATRLYIADQVNVEGRAWARVRTTTGRDGYMPGDVRVKNVEAAAATPSARAAGIRNMLVGALWCIGGIAVTAYTYSSASDSGGTYLIMWGPILFGGIQCLRGIFETLTAKN